MAMILLIVNWFQVGSRRVDPDPVVCESQRGLWRDAGHVAVDAVPLGCIGIVSARMATGANCIVMADVVPKLLMWIVAGEAGELSLALAETCALAEVHRLMAHIPREVPVDTNVRGSGRPVAFSAKLIQLAGLHETGVADIPCFRGAGMCVARSVTAFAVNSGFRRCDAVSGRIQRAR